MQVSTPIIAGDETYLTPKQVCERYGGKLKERTLARWRFRNSTFDGPPFIKVGPQVYYPLSLLVIWEKGNLRVSHFLPKKETQSNKAQTVSEAAIAGPGITNDLPVSSLQASVEARWYWLDARGVQWVRRNLPGARIEAQGRVIDYAGNYVEPLEATAVMFPRGGVTKARRGGISVRPVGAVDVQETCSACKLKYIPFREDDPCIRGLPSIKYACCGHGEKRGYLYFDDGRILRFSGFKVEYVSD